MPTQPTDKIALKTGDAAVHVERLGFGGKDREIVRVTIARETATLLIDNLGTRWRKRDGAMVPQYVAPRFIVPAAKVSA